MQQSADRETIHRSRQLETHLHQNWKKWHIFVTDVLQVGIDIDEMIFISGTHKTANWAVASYVEAGRSSLFRFDASSPMVSCAFSLLSSSGVEMPPHQHWGPQRRTSSVTGSPSSQGSGDVDQNEIKKDQCVFINYYKMKRRRLFPPKVLRASAGYDRLSPRRDEDGRIGGIRASVDCDEESEEYELHTDNPSVEVRVRADWHGKRLTSGY